MMALVIKKAENIVGKGENAGSPFPTVFCKGYFLGLLKLGIVLSRAKSATKELELIGFKRNVGKEKLLVTSIFSFSHHVFERLHP